MLEYCDTYSTERATECVELHLRDVGPTPEDKESALRLFGSCAGPLDPCYTTFLSWLRLEVDVFEYERCVTEQHDVSL